MSGPKVVRIVTREERVAQCETLLRQLEAAMARWSFEAGRIGEISEQDWAHARERFASIDALLKEDRFADLRGAVATELRFLERDLAERQERAITHAADKRMYARRLGENASALMGALRERSGTAVGLVQALEAAARGEIDGNTEALLARAVTQLAIVPTAADTTSEAQSQLARRLGTGEAGPTLAEWIARQGTNADRDERWVRVERYVAERQLLDGADVAAPFMQRLTAAEAESDRSRRDLLLDSLVLDLAEACRESRQRREQLARLHELASEVAALHDETHARLLVQVERCMAVADIAEAAVLIDECIAAISARMKQEAAHARRHAVLQGLASLGYEIREGMETGWAESGRVVLRKSATPGYGIEVGGRGDDGRIQIRAVAMSPGHDKRRDRDIETIWCSELDRLKALLKDQGAALDIERALAAGEMPLKEVTVEAETQTTVSVANERTDRSGR